MLARQLQSGEFFMMRSSKEEEANEGKYWWCETCTHAHTLNAWHRSNNVCPTEGCRTFMNAAFSWESIYAKHEDYPTIPDPNVKYPR
jgi:hypothetical protein